MIRHEHLTPFLEKVEEERGRQVDKFGDQSHLPVIGTSEGYTPAVYEQCAEAWKNINARAFPQGKGGWDGILLEEVWEALSETDPEKYEAELIQVAAVACAMFEASRRRRGQTEAEPTEAEPYIEGVSADRRAPRIRPTEGASWDELVGDPVLGTGTTEPVTLTFRGSDINSEALELLWGRTGRVMPSREEIEASIPEPTTVTVRPVVQWGDPAPPDLGTYMDAINKLTAELAILAELPPHLAPSLRETRPFGSCCPHPAVDPDEPVSLTPEETKRLRAAASHLRYLREL